MMSSPRSKQSGRKKVLRNQSTLFLISGCKSALPSWRSTSIVLRMLLVLLAMTRDEMVAKAVGLVPPSSAFVDMRILGQLAAASSYITARPAIGRVLVDRDPDSLSKDATATLRRVFGQNYGVLQRHGVLRQVLERWGALVSLSARYSHVCSASFIGAPGAPRHLGTSEHGSVSILEPDARFSMSKTFREYS